MWHCGNIHQARWFNREYRILRVYVSEEDPSEELIRLVNYIVMVYIPVFLDIKHYGLFEFGPLHLLKEIMLVQEHCTQEEQEVIHPIIKWNGFMAHPENIQVSLLCSTRMEDRMLAIKTILEIREKGVLSWPRRKGEPMRPDGSKGIRPFQVPSLNWKARSLEDLVDKSLYITEPPLTQELTGEQLKSLAFTSLQLPGFPCHTTSCERAVQLTTSSAMLSSSSIMQDGESFAKMAAKERNQAA